LHEAVPYGLEERVGPLDPANVLNLHYAPKQLFILTGAFEILVTSNIHVVLCDQRMPDISGTKFLSRMKQMYPAIIRMVLSGYTDLQSVTDAVNRDAIFKFLTKPWEKEEFLTALADACREYESHQDTYRQLTVSVLR
jgi:DNA-binding NtrC family response regulator